jgi:glc operon protein GlcG
MGHERAHAAQQAARRSLGHGITLKCDKDGTRFVLHQGEGAGFVSRSKNETGAKAEANIRKAKGSTMKLAIGVGILATFFCLSVGAQTISALALDQAGAQTVLQAAKENAERRNAPSAIAVVDPAGDLLAFQRMDRVRPASADLAVEKARTAARLQRPTAEIEDNINHGRTAFVTADIMALRGGTPIRVNGEVVGAVGVAGLSKETDTEIANAAAAALSPH